MPVYLYSCDCTEFEEVRKVDDRDKGVGRICSLCGTTVERSITSSTFILKEGGCGWANTGYTGTLGGAVKNGGFKSE